jgi:DNA-binding LacI/PurR family transcriptional regulator
MRHRIGSVDVAQRAGVSRATVSYVLNGRKDVTIPTATRERVLRAARELGYRPNRIASSLAWGRTQTLGIVLPRLDNSFMADVVSGVQESCGPRTYRTIIVNSVYQRDVEDGQVQNLLEHLVDGIICLPRAPFPPPGESWLQRVREERVPCVIVDADAVEVGFDSVVSADRKGAEEAVDHLIRLGHRRIAHLCGYTHARSVQERLAGYREALARRGIAFDPVLVAGDTWDRSEMAVTAVELLSRAPAPTALFASNDVLASIAMKAARQHGMQVPADLAVVGFGDLDVADWIGLTSVCQSPREMGRLAAERLFSRMTEPELEPRLIVQPTRLVVRDTCGAAGRAPV